MKKEFTCSGCLKKYECEENCLECCNKPLCLDCEVKNYCPSNLKEDFME